MLTIVTGALLRISSFPMTRVDAKTQLCVESDRP